MQDLITKAEKLIQKKIRVAVYGKEFNKLNIAGVPHVRVV
jgi:hypothetical protein